MPFAVPRPRIIRPTKPGRAAPKPRQGRFGEHPDEISGTNHEIRMGKVAVGDWQQIGDSERWAFITATAWPETFTITPAGAPVTLKTASSDTFVGGTLSKLVGAVPDAPSGSHRIYHLTSQTGLDAYCRVTFNTAGDPTHLCWYSATSKGLTGTGTAKLIDLSKTVTFKMVTFDVSTLKGCYFLSQELVA
ncbi:MAG: hypothetical protein H6739_09935 [Alphaproteobacteria bacterium]|nr:hypothetical protein [Alphaproteobacteria bacterium]